MTTFFDLIQVKWLVEAEQLELLRRCAPLSLRCLIDPSAVLQDAAFTLSLCRTEKHGSAVAALAEEYAKKLGSRSTEYLVAKVVEHACFQRLPYDLQCAGNFLLQLANQHSRQSRFGDFHAAEKRLLDPLNKYTCAGHGSYGLREYLLSSALDGTYDPSKYGISK